MTTRSRATGSCSSALAKEGRLGLWNWLMLLLGVRGTYRKNDSVDVQYETSAGQTRLATRVDFEPVTE